jgi:ferredoxin-NADP reductase
VAISFNDVTLSSPLLSNIHTTSVRMEKILKDKSSTQTAEPVTDGYVVKVLETEMLTHNVKRFLLEKPEGYFYIPGQATDISINLPGLRSELRPFTITSLTSDPHLEFIIKIYKGHEGITEKLENIHTGDELNQHDVFGNLAYRGPGLFIAGGAGITPFIAILRQLKQQNGLGGCSLLFANRSARDIILRDELHQLLADNYADVLEISEDPASPGGFINRSLLAKYVKPENQYCYICGPEKFVSIITNHLTALGVRRSQIIIEE